MLHNQNALLEKLIDELEKANHECGSNGESSTFIEFSDSEQGKEAVLRGNSQGLTYLSLCLLKLAISETEGKHFHFDEYSGFDKCDKALVVGYKRADWELAPPRGAEGGGGSESSNP